MKNVIAILRCYEAISGLKVIFFKGALIGISVEYHPTAHLAGVMGHKVGLFRHPTLGCLLAFAVFQGHCGILLWRELSRKWPLGGLGTYL